MDSEERHKWSDEERALLQRLDALLREPSVLQEIDRVAAELLARTPSGSEKLLDRERVPIAIYGPNLPSLIRSCWIYLMREPAMTTPERHPNSHQRTMAYKGTGFFEVNEMPDFDGEGDGATYFLEGGFTAPLETRWASIPENLWHQAVVTEGDWVMVSFHTATENELIEEHPS